MGGVLFNPHSKTLEIQVCFFRVRHTAMCLIPPEHVLVPKCILLCFALTRGEIPSNAHNHVSYDTQACSVFFSRFLDFVSCNFQPLMCLQQTYEMRLHSYKYKLYNNLFMNAQYTP